MNYQQLAKLFEVEKHEQQLIKALTHKSFYANNEEKSNSRYVFLGMFGFRGKVAELLYDYQPLGGTQLQHYLGNIFKEELLNRIYAKFELGKIIRFGEGFDVQKHKHIFVYGLLGFLCKYASVEKLNRFIVNHFLIGTEHLIPGFAHNKDTFAQCNYFTMLLYQKAASIQTTKNSNNRYATTISVGNQIISTFTSRSFTYSRKKAIKDALLLLSGQLASEYVDNPIYQAALAERKQKEAEEVEKLKTENIRNRNERFARKRLERRHKQQKEKELALRRDQERRKAKQAAKLRKEKQQELEAKAAAALARMSGKKRRHLDDKKK
jgi:hypothetical protein